jgi:hypothetical protein
MKFTMKSISTLVLVTVLGAISLFLIALTGYLIESSGYKPAIIMFSGFGLLAWVFHGGKLVLTLFVIKGTSRGRRW